MRPALVHYPTLRYPKKAPFHPDRAFAELCHDGPFDGDNQVYGAVREVLRLAGLDAAHEGTPDWRPFRDLVAPGNRVVLKPNLVLHSPDGDYDKLVTHASVVRPVVDYLLQVTEQLEITICDVPLQDARFDEIVAGNGLRALVDWYRDHGVNICLRDLRQFRAELDDSGFLRRTVPLPGDPRGYRLVSLGAASALEPITAPGVRFGVSKYDAQVTNRYHRPGHHAYLIAGTVLDADLVINLPKLKTHQKAGITGALKNMVGIIGSKDCLPHYRLGAPAVGGDQYRQRSLFNRASAAFRGRYYARFPWLWRLLKRGVAGYRRLARISAEQHLTDGAWEGNDTTWRMVHDLNKVLLFADREGRMQQAPQRKYLALVDAITCGEGNGPLYPERRDCGMLLCGDDPLVLDAVGAKLIGADPAALPLIGGFAEVAGIVDLPFDRHWRQAALQLDQGPCTVDRIGPRYRFRPPPGWVFVSKEESSPR